MTSSGMVDGYVITYDGEELVIAPRGGPWEIEIDDLSISGDGNRLIFSPAGSLPEVHMASRRVAKPDGMTQEATFARGTKKCINCNGKRYCAKNGCIKTPCGWLCD